MANLFPSAYEFQFDDTARNPLNLVHDEEQMLNDNRHDIPVVLNHGVFYTEGFSVHKENGVPMTLGEDYGFIGKEPFVTAQTGHETASAILIKDTSYLGKLYCTVQYVGGPEGKSNALIIDLIKAINYAVANPTILFTQIKGLPSAFKPQIHRHHPSELTDLDLIARDFRLFANAIINSRQLGTSGLMLDERVSTLLRIVALQRDAINDIVATTGNGARLIALEEAIANTEYVADRNMPSIVENMPSIVGTWELSDVNTINLAYSFKTTDGRTQAGYVLVVNNGLDVSITEYGDTVAGELADDEDTLVLFEAAIMTTVIQVTATAAISGNLKVRLVNVF